MFTYAHGECRVVEITDIASITAHTNKHVNHPKMEPTGIGSFTPNKLATLIKVGVNVNSSEIGRSLKKGLKCKKKKF